MDVQEWRELVEHLGTTLTDEDMAGPIGEQLSLGTDEKLSKHKFLEVMAFVEQEKRRQIVVAARKVREANIHTVFDAYASRQYTTARLDDHGFRRATTKLGIELSAKERKSSWRELRKRPTGWCRSGFL